VVEVPEGELPRTPRGIAELRPRVKDAFVFVLVEEQVGIVYDSRVIAWPAVPASKSFSNGN